MSALKLGEARRAGTKALADYYGEEIEDSSYSLDARVAIRAAAPLIEDQVREQIAREIEMWTEQYAIATGWICDHDFDGATCGRCFGNAQHASTVAVRIARGQS